MPSIATLGRIALCGFVLNSLWEVAHAGPLYDMWQKVSFGMGLFYVTWATLGDVLIVLGVATAAALVVGWARVLTTSPGGLVALLAFGFAASVVLEGIALALGWWTYNARMPVLPVAELELGLSPIAQVTLLPALSVHLARRLSPSLFPG